MFLCFVEKNICYPMNKSHLISILRTCSKKELRELRKWLHSPAHNQREDVQLLLNYLTRKDHLHQASALEKEVVFMHIHPNETYNDAKMRQTIHFFMKTLEAFLLYQEISTDSIQAKTILARIYRKRKLDKPFVKQMKVNKQLLEGLEIRNGQFLRNQYQLAEEGYLYYSNIKRTNLNLQETSNALDATYIADKLRQSCLMLAHQTVYKIDYHIGLLPEVLNYVEQNQLLQVPAIAMYYYTYKTITDKQNDDHFTHLQREITQSGGRFPREELRDIYLHALNYCIGKTNAGDAAYIRKAFELYKEGFERNAFIEENNLSRWTFLNVVINGLKLQEYEWVAEFMGKYQQYVDEKYRDSFMNYGQALLHYELGHYEAAMRLLVQFDTNEVIVNLRAKNLLLKMYYEQDEFDVLESLLESMRNFLVRKKVMGYHKANFNNFIKMTRKLLKVNPFQAKDKEKLKAEMEAINPLTTEDRAWLLEQLDKV